MKSSLLETFNSLDWFVFFFITGSTLLVVFISELKRKVLKKNADNSILDLLLMGRRLTLLPFIATLVATWYGGIFGTAQIAFESGIYNFITQGLFWYITYFIFAKFILPKIKNQSAATLPELIGEIIGPKSQKVSAIFNILNLVPIAYSISLGLLIQMIFPMSLFYAQLLGVTIVCLYSAGGGLRSVVISDCIQFFVMYSSVVILFLYGMLSFGFEPLKSLPDYYFSPLSQYGLSETLIWGFIALSTLVDPNFYQRSFAAINKETAKAGIYVSIFIWFTFDISLTFGAMYAKSLLPVAQSQDGYFQYAFKILPQGARGYFLAGIAATIMSTLDSYLFLSSTTLVYDLFPKLKHKKGAYFVSFMLIAALSLLLGLSFEGNIKEVWKAMGSISSAALLLPLTLNLFASKKMSDRSFLYTTLISAVVVVAWRLSGLNNKTGLDELYPGVMTSALMCLVFTKLALNSNEET